MAQQLEFCSVISKLSFGLCIFAFLNLAVATFNIIGTLPGYPTPLPFNLETGYIGVGEDEEIQLFYYFIESERDPQRDPLLFWLTGGPGCSGFSGLVYEIGPLKFDDSSFDGSFPSFILNPYSWTKIANIIFIDSPVGTGFSYANTSERYKTSDSKSAMDNYAFLRKWLLNHPSYIKNHLYVAGDSYGGKIVPMVTLEIAKWNEAGLEPSMALRGYIIGNAVTDLKKDYNEKVPYAHRMALISDEYYETARSSCNGEYRNPDPTNVPCLYALQRIKECIKNVDESHILEPKCGYYSQAADETKLSRMILEADPENFLPVTKRKEMWCRNSIYWASHVWTNNQFVRESLRIRKGTKKQWRRCDKSLPYDQDVTSVFQYHQLLNEKGYQLLAYSGDHDLTIPYTSTLKWIRALNLTVYDEWRPWLVDGQVSGYTEKYMNRDAYVTFATIKVRLGLDDSRKAVKQMILMLIVSKGVNGTYRSGFFFSKFGLNRLVWAKNILVQNGNMLD